ncbi:MAG: aminotransferase class V-fold PLP-dependent enzyme, partial [Candidatus Micrarchaeia archaeon]
GTAIGYLEGLGMDEVRKHDLKLTKYALGKLAEVRGLRILGAPEAGKRAGIISFTIDGIHPHDVAQALDSEGIAVRAGHHCAQPLHERLGINGSVRASFYIYNDLEDVDALCSGLEKARTKFL